MTADPMRDATADAALVAGGTAGPAEMIEAALDRIDERDPALNAVIHRRDEKARAEAAATDRALPLAGVAVCVKDVGAETAGDPYHCGMAALARRGWRASYNAEVVTRLRRAGATIVGRTHTPELASSFFTEPAAYGPTGNPWDTGRSAGGSSGGSAAAVAAGMVPAAHGNDMAGSLRVPAALCGVVGLKPTRGRIPTAPLAQRWSIFGHEGVLARSVRDCGMLLDVLAGAAVGDPYAAPASDDYAAAAQQPPGQLLRVGLRIATPVRREAPDEACAAAAEGAAERLAALGHRVETAWPALLDEDLSDALNAYNVEVARDVERWSELLGECLDDELEPRNVAMAERGRSISGTAYLQALDRLHAWARHMAVWWTAADEGGDGFDLLVTPTVPFTAPPLGWGPSTPGAEQRAGAYTRPWNITGQPAISLPLSTTDERLPVGVQLIASAGREDLLLSAATQLLPRAAAATTPLSTQRST